MATRRYKVLFVTPEVTPIIKVGGLGDVAGALPKALEVRGHDVRIILPDYGVIDRATYPSDRCWSNLRVRWESRDVQVNINEGVLPGSTVPVYYLDYPEQFEYGGVYVEKAGGDALKRAVRHFVFFSTAVAQVLDQIDWQPDLVHCHDWPAALVPSLLRRSKIHNHTPTVLTIHNLENQGGWPAQEVLGWLGFTDRQAEFFSLRDRYKSFNLLQQGIHAATVVNTVSPTYAKEILTPELGEGLDQDLSERPSVQGVLNGIDTEQFDPATDPHIAFRYSAKTVTRGKAQNKSALQKAFALPANDDKLLIGSVGRLTSQKGYDLLAAIGPDVASLGLEIVMLGSGHSSVEQALQRLAQAHPAWFRLRIGFDARLAQQIYAGADVFLMPSRFEPCGLGQLIAMRYGTLPVVRATGGLKDTVSDLGLHPHQGTGFVFENFQSAALLSALQQASHVFRTNKKLFADAIRRAMNQDFSWGASAAVYEKLYAAAIKQNTSL